jgi:drug/metabolite transporter (DMT)-like permease
MKSDKIDTLSWIVFATLTLIWGSSFILMKKALLVFESEQVATLRISIAAITFLPVLIFTRKNVKKEHFKIAASVGLIGSFLPAFCFTTAQKHLDSSVAGVLNSLTPFFTVITAALFFKEKIPKDKVIGVMVGLSGAVLMASSRGGAAVFSSINQYAILIVISTFFYGLNANIVKKNINALPAYTLNALALSLMLLPCIFILYYTDVLATFNQKAGSMRALLYVALLGSAGTGLAGYLYFWLIQRRGLLFGVMVTYAMPVVALFWGVMDRETLTVWHFVSLILIFIGVYLVNKPSNSPEIV